MTKLSYNLEEASAATGIHPKAIRAAINSGQLKAKRQSRNDDGDGVGKLIITTRNLESWLDALADA